MTMIIEKKELQFGLSVYFLSHGKDTADSGCLQVLSYLKIKNKKQILSCEGVDWARINLGLKTLMRPIKLIHSFIAMFSPLIGEWIN